VNKGRLRHTHTNQPSGSFDIHMSVHCNIITNYSQQDATFLEFIYFYRHSTCFGRFLCPSSRAHNCTYSFKYCQPILLLGAAVEKMELCAISSISTCFGRFLRPSSGAHNCTYSFKYCQPILLLAATVEKMAQCAISSTVAASSSIG
jgi:hypothetical protein